MDSQEVGKIIEIKKEVASHLGADVEKIGRAHV